MANTDRKRRTSVAKTPSKKRATPTAKRVFPPEAFDYGGDILPEDVERLRKRAEPFISGGKWRVIDG